MSGVGKRLLAWRSEPDGEGIRHTTIDEDPDTFMDILRFLYTGALDIDATNVRVWVVVADSYGFAGASA